MRGIQTRETAQKVVDAMRTNYNFVRKHSTIKKTPAEKAGIKLNLGENRIEALIRIAAIKLRTRYDITMKTSERGLNSKMLYYVYDEVSKLIMNNYEEGIGNVHSRAKDSAYRDVLAILTRILNK